MTCTGTLLTPVVPFQSCPFPFVPRHRTVPSFFKAQVDNCCSTTSATPIRFAVKPVSFTSTGLFCCVKVPSHTCPLPFLPRHLTPESAISAQLVEDVLCILNAPVRISTGDVLSVIVPSPSCPLVFFPIALINHVVVTVKLASVAASVCRIEDHHCVELTGDVL